MSQEAVPSALPVSVGPGARLKAGREAQQQSLEQAARHLRLDEPTLAAIESDQYPAHVPSTFLRGYLRAYAKWLELPADEIVAAYNDKQPGEAQLAGLKSLLALPESERSRGGKWLWSVLGVVVVGVVIAVLFALLPADWLSRLRSSGSEPTSVVQPANEVAGSDAASGELALQLAPEEPLLVEVPTDALPVTAADAATPVETKPSAATASPAAPVSAVSAQTAAANPDSLPGINEAIELSFVEDCWIRVTDASGSVLSVGIKLKGSRIRLSGAAPLTVVLGNPPGVQLRHNGRPVDLSSYPGSRPATITVQSPAND